VTVLFLIATFSSCSNLAGIKGKFSEPIKGKALSVIVRRVYSGGPGSESVMLEISNLSSGKVVITPLKLKVIGEDGSETETTYNLKRKSLEQIEITGGAIIGGTLAVSNPNQNDQVSPDAPAALAAGEKIVFNTSPGKSRAEKLQLSIGPPVSKEQEVFAITK
jgi:hypothetical protein